MPHVELAIGEQNYNGLEPVNLDTGFEIKIKDLIEMIKEATGFRKRHI